MVTIGIHMAAHQSERESENVQDAQKNGEGGTLCQPCPCAAPNLCEPTRACAHGRVRRHQRALPFFDAVIVKVLPVAPVIWSEDSTRKTITLAAVDCCNCRLI